MSESSVEFAPACEAQDPDSNYECTKPIGHGGIWHGNEFAFWKRSDDK